LLAPALSATFVPRSGSQRVDVATQSKALFKELEFERNMEGAITFLKDVPQARALGRDSLEFLASTVSFDGFASFDDPINEGMLARETTPAKLDYVRRAVAKVRAALALARAACREPACARRPRACRRWLTRCCAGHLHPSRGCARARAFLGRGSRRARSTRSSRCSTPPSSSRRGSSQMTRASPNNAPSRVLTWQVAPP
jgi:hypothetical protein